MEQMCEFMFPFQWPNIFITVFPAPLVDFLQAFVPFIFGMNTRVYEKFMRDGAVPDEICVVDLNKNEIRVAGSFRMLSVHQVLSEKLLNVLTELTPAAAGAPFQRGHHKGHSRTASAFDFGKIEDLPQIGKVSTGFSFQIKWHSPLNPPLFSPQENNPVRMAFLDFFVRLMSFYRRYLSMPEGQLNSMLDLFDQEGFIRTKSDISRKFYEDIIQSQLFSQFLEKRTFHSELDEAFNFFDSKMDRYETLNMQDNASDLVLFEPEPDQPDTARLYTVADINVENLQPVTFFFSFLFFQLLPIRRKTNHALVKLFVEQKRFPKFSEEAFIKVRRPEPFNLASAPKGIIYLFFLTYSRKVSFNYYFVFLSHKCRVHRGRQQHDS